MGKIKISIHNLYKNIINYNIFGGSKVGDIAIRFNEFSNDPRPWGDRTPSPSDTENSDDEERDEEYDKKINLEEKKEQEIAKTNSGNFLKKIIRLLIKKRLLNTTITNTTNHITNLDKDKKLEDDVQKKLENDIKEYKKLHNELEYLKQTIPKIPAIENIQLFRYLELFLNNYKNIISLISKYWSKTSFTSKDIKKILNSRNQIEQHIKKKILEKIELTEITNDELLNILKDIAYPRELISKYPANEILQEISNFIDYVKNVKSKDTQDKFEHYGDKVTNIINLPENSKMFGNINFKLNENLELVGYTSSLKDSKKKYLKFVNGKYKTPNLIIPLYDFVKYQMKYREKYNNFYNIRYLDDFDFEHNKFKFKSLGIDYTPKSFFWEEVILDSDDFTYKGEDYPMEDNMKTWEKILNKVKIGDADKKLTPREAEAAPEKAKEEQKAKVGDETVKVGDDETVKKTLVNDDDKKVAEIGFEQKAQAAKKAKEEAEARKKRFELEKKKIELEEKKFEETKKTQKQRLELEKEKFDAENYTLADCRKNIQEYKFYNLRNQIEMSKLMTKYNKNEYIIKNLLKDNNFDFAKVEKKLEGDKFKGDKFKSDIGKYDEGKIVIKVPKLY